MVDPGGANIVTGAKSIDRVFKRAFFFAELEQGVGSLGRFEIALKNCIVKRKTWTSVA